MSGRHDCQYDMLSEGWCVRDPNRDPWCQGLPQRAWVDAWTLRVQSRLLPPLLMICPCQPQHASLHPGGAPYSGVLGTDDENAEGVDHNHHNPIIYCLYKWNRKDPDPHNHWRKHSHRFTRTKSLMMGQLLVKPSNPYPEIGSSKERSWRYGRADQA